MLVTETAILFFNEPNKDLFASSFDPLNFTSFFLDSDTDTSSSDLYFSSLISSKVKKSEN